MGRRGGAGIRRYGRGRIHRSEKENAVRIFRACVFDFLSSPKTGSRLSTDVDRRGRSGLQTLQIINGRVFVETLATIVTYTFVSM